MPVFSREWGSGKPFDQIVDDIPIASGPYRIGHVDFGRDITYQRDPNYWAARLNVRLGQYNFDRVTYKIYKDTTAQTEAFKAGEFDYIQVFSSREWARVYVGKKFTDGELIRRDLPSDNAGDFQGFLINTRRKRFADARVRQAIGLAMDFEWMNREFFYGQYTRVRGYFNASDFEAKGLPGPDELAVLAPLRGKLPPAVFTQPVPMPPSTDPPAACGPTCARPSTCSTRRAGPTGTGPCATPRGSRSPSNSWTAKGAWGASSTPTCRTWPSWGSSATTGWPTSRCCRSGWTYSTSTSPASAPWAPRRRAATSRTGSPRPRPATEGSGNLMGVRDPAVDILVQEATNAATRPELVARLRALDRVLRFGHYFVPAWYANGFRIAYRAGKFSEPAVAPRYFQAENWIIAAWWTKR
jgi:microcin C transport system substrate-binding protein